MSMLLNFKKCLIAVLLFCSIQFVQAQVFHFNERINTTSTAAQVTIGTTTATKTVTVSPLLPSGGYKDVMISDKITLGVDHSLMDSYIPNAAVIKVTLNIEQWDINSNPLPLITTDLTLNYQPFGNTAAYIDKTVYNFNNAYTYKITIQAITENNIPVQVLQKNLFIDAGIFLERYTDFSVAAYNPISFNQSQAIDLDCDNMIDELQVSWPIVSGAVEYQLEWTFVNDYDALPGTYRSLASLPLLEFDFKNNSTRITTAKTNYNITLAFEHGYLLYRIRAIGRDMTDPSQSIVGVWNADGKGNVDTLLNRYYNQVEHEANKNWQYAATYAEEGKKKEVISYFDGSLRNRQSVTKVNSDSNTIVGETIYDHQGRPGINVLPVPVKNPVCITGTSVPSIKYYPGFNKNEANTGYSRIDFDLDASPADSCNSITNGMSTVSGASNYYSPGNPNKNGAQAFVPDAEKFPFTQIEYTPDNTGRIRRQGGVGPQYQLGKNHETKYFYGWPNQIQLDRMFGSEVGDASHYKKNLVIDANGQVSVNYLDQEGRTIATSLAGDAPKDQHGTTILAPLASESASTKLLMIDMFAKDANGKSNANTINVQRDAIVFNSQLLVAFKSDYEFHYNLVIDTLFDPCLKQNICFNCVYDLEIKVTDDCGKAVIPLSGINPVKKTIGHFTAGKDGKVVSFKIDCSIPAKLKVAENFKLNLDAGNYTVSKILTVNSDARDFYVKTYLDTINTANKLGEFVNLKPGCVRTFQSFLDSAMAHIDTANCKITCGACDTSLKTINGIYYPDAKDARDAFVAAGNGTGLDFDYFLEECGAPCKEISICETTYEMLLMDVSPDGQYAEFQTKADGSPPDLSLSVLSTTNVLPKTIAGQNANWTNPMIKINGTNYPYYLEENGNRSTIRLQVINNQIPVSITPNNFMPAIVSVAADKLFKDVAGGFYYTYPENLANVSDFVAYWTDNWAKSLVQYHPEYCYYEDCIQYSQKSSSTVLSSDEFDNLLLKTIEFSDALSVGLVSPGAMNFMRDPFYSTLAGTGIITNFKFNPITTTYYSMLQMAAIAANCGTSYGSLSVPPTCLSFGTGVVDSIKDKEWNLLKNFYLSEKQKLQKQLADNNALQNCKAYNGCIGNSSYNPFTSGMINYGSGYWFFNNSPYYNPLQPCSGFFAANYLNKKKRFNPDSNLETPGADEMDYQNYLQTGQCPLATDLQYLLGTLAGKQELASNALVQLKDHPEFTQDMYTAVSGGTMPSVFVSYTWTAITPASNNILTANIRNANSVVCTVTLDKTGTGIGLWNDVVNISNLKYTVTNGTNYEFTATAAIANPTGSLKPFSYKTIKGSSCINITGCSFQKQCKPNDLANDLSNLWSALLVNHELTAQNVNLDHTLPTLANYKNFVTLNIKNALGTVNNTLRWNYNLGTFELYDYTNPSKKLIIKFIGFIPATFSLANLPGVLAFSGIKGDDQNGFTVNGVDAAYVKLVSIAGTVNLFQNGITTPVSMGKCGLPGAILCQEDEYRLRTDLEALLADVLLKKPFNPNFDITLSTKYTNLINAYVPEGKQLLANKYDKIILNRNNDYKEQFYINIGCGCKVILSHKGKGNLQLLFSNLIRFENLTAYGEVAFDNNYYHFYALATYALNGRKYSDTIFGESCLPLKNCTPSISTDTVVSPIIPYVNPCIESQINLAHGNAENAWHQYIDSLTTEIARKYNEHCLSALENFTAKYTDKEYHFTLYYYDQAGNLVRTIPPEGVQLVPITAPPTLPIITPQTPAELIAVDRTNNTHNFFTGHTMATTYQYNSLNQLVRQSMPDHDLMDIWDYSLPNGLDNRLKITATQFVTATKGYLSGFVNVNVNTRRGYLYNTDDGGVTWTKMNGLVASDLKKIQMLDAFNGFAVGSHGIVLKTTNGGGDWDMISLNSIGVVTTLNDLFFTSALNGVVIGNNGVILKTTDGAVNFTSIAPAITAGYQLNSITWDGAGFFIGAGNAAGEGQLFKAIANNATFTSLTNSSWSAMNSIRSTDLSCIQMLNQTLYPNQGFAAGADGTLLHTSNGGTSWVTVSTGTSSNFKKLHFKSNNEGVAILEAVAGQGQIYKTTNGGINWSLISVPGEYYNDFYFYQNDKGYAVGTNGKLKRLVMSGSYGLVSIVTAPFIAPTDNLATVYFSDADHGWVSGNSGTAYYTNNATSNAITWQAVGNLPASGIKKMYFGHTLNSGIALSNSGALYKISQAGTTYTFTQISIPADNFVDIDDDAGYVYGFDKTSRTVKKIPKNFSSGFSTIGTVMTVAAASKVVAISAQIAGNIYTAGKEGDLFTGTSAWTDNSAKTIPLAINDVEAAGTGNIYAVGNEGTLLQTTNGNDWKTLPTASALTFNAIKFTSNPGTPLTYRGLIAGNNGLLLATSATPNVNPLSPVPLTTSENLYDIALKNINSTNTYKAYVAGAHGTLISIPDILNPAPVFATLKPAEDFRGICFIPSFNAVYTVGDNSALYNYNNASGAKVKNVYTPKLNDVHFANTQNGYTVGEKGTIRHTADGGNSWQYVEANAVQTINAVWTKQADKAIAVGDGGYMASITGTTAAATNFGLNNLYDVAINNSIGYIVGASGAVYRSTDAGTSWSLMLAAPNVTMRAIHIFQNNNFIAVGDNKIIYCYNGFTWIPQVAPASVNPLTRFNDVFFHDDRNGYVVGTGGVVLKCTLPTDIYTYPLNTVPWNVKLLSGINGVPTPTQVDITSLAFSNRYNGFIGGMFNIASPNPGYARLLNDESNIFSTRFWYDRLGRMVVSQNTKQFNRVVNGLRDYSYTLYDELGRIKEVGEEKDNATSNNFANIFGTYINDVYNPHVIDDAKLTAFINAGTRKEVTRTYYDNTAITGLPITQDNLRKRVACVTYEDTDDNNVQTYQHATHYSYDIHGNVKKLIQDNPTITIAGQRFKKTDYDYDLISGKVNVVRYQDGQPDAMYHFYRYDADNRITDVYTSTWPQANTMITDSSVQGNPLWDHDARYLYYAHGPLARVELGDNKVQGIDYAYTLQGWIKGVNSNALKSETDIGNDGLTSGTNKVFAKDAFGYTLGYHTGDYKPIDALKWSPVTNRFEAVTTVSDMAAARYDLFNGNISQMVTTITEPKIYMGIVNETPATVLPQGSAYKYDQLNRLLEANAFTNIDLFTNAWKIGSTTPVRYHNAFKYDANGNITYQERADANGLVFDKLNYRYKTVAGRITQNRLYHVNDAEAGSLVTDDIDDQGAFTNAPASPVTINDVNNYRYDEIGNLKHDDQEEIERIDWTVYGKIKRIIRKSSSAKPDLEFNYDASGNRIAKIIKPHGSSVENGGADNRALWTTTFYSRDAQGNIMTTYKLATTSFKVTERNIFGSSRLGMENTELELNPALPISNTFNRTLGYKAYEESNHLGNVLATVSDKKVPHSANGTTIDYYLANVLSSQDYYSFGMAMKGRSFTGTSSYRYGFNGQEKDDEVEGNGDSYDYGARIYDPRISRWMSIDLYFSKYPGISPYAFGVDNPIYYRDKDGKDVGGGFLIKNNSDKPITFAGDGQQVVTFADGSSTKINGTNKTWTDADLKKAGETRGNDDIRDQFTLNQGDSYVPTKKVVSLKNGATLTVYGGTITRKDGKKEYTNVFDVDRIVVKEGQTFKVDGTDVTEKNTKDTEGSYDKNRGQIQIRPSISLYVAGYDNPGEITGGFTIENSKNEKGEKTDSLEINQIVSMKVSVGDKKN